MLSRNDEQRFQEVDQERANLYLHLDKLRGKTGQVAILMENHDEKFLMQHAQDQKRLLEKMMKIEAAIETKTNELKELQSKMVNFSQVGIESPKARMAEKEHQEAEQARQEKLCKEEQDKIDEGRRQKELKENLKSEIEKAFKARELRAKAATQIQVFYRAYQSRKQLASDEAALRRQVSGRADPKQGASEEARKKEDKKKKFYRNLKIAGIVLGIIVLSAAVAAAIVFGGGLPFFATVGGKVGLFCLLSLVLAKAIGGIAMAVNLIARAVKSRKNSQSQAGSAPKPVLVVQSAPRPGSATPGITSVSKSAINQEKGAEKGKASVSCFGSIFGGGDKKKKTLVPLETQAPTLRK
jgi:ABC-type multidrug transport system fused ATPase/permease subunit